jgi:hypothetical protein
MAFVLADRVKQTSASTGTGAFTLSATVFGFRAFSSVLATSDTTYYTIAHQSLDEWEVGYGTYSSANTLTRTKVISSTNAGAAVNFSAGNKDVFITLPAVGAFGNNIVLGSNLTYNQSSSQSSVILGTGITNGGTGTSVVIGAGASNAASGTVIVGNGASSAATSGNAVIIGASANANSLGTSSVAVGGSAFVAGNGAVALGNGTTAGPDSLAVGGSASTGSFSSGAIAIGNGAQANYDFSTIIGYATLGSSTGYEIRLGASQTAGTGSQNILIGNSINTATWSKSNTIAIGNGITVLESNATYMNKFRTGITPVGTSRFLKWDDSTNEVYADSGVAGANWYTYQDNGSSSSSLNLAAPSGIATSSNPGSEGYVVLQSSIFISGWSFGSSFGPFYASTPNSYPVSTPLTGAMYSGMATCYYAGYTTDAGTSSTYQAYTGTSAYSTSGTSFSVASFSLFGTTQYGHAVLTASGSYIGGFTPSSGVTLVEEKYDSWNNYTYFFVDIDATALSGISTGGSIGSLSSSSGTIYIAIWYNY